MTTDPLATPAQTRSAGARCRCGYDLTGISPGTPCPECGVPTPDPRTLGASRECHGCGYDLVGIAPDKPCPECGKPAGETYKHPLLRVQPVDVRRRTRRALRLLLLTAVWLTGGALVSWIVGGVLIALLPRDMAPAVSAIGGIVLATGWIVPNIVGTLMLTRAPVTRRWVPVLASGGLGVAGVCIVGMILTVWQGELTGAAHPEVVIGRLSVICCLAVASHLIGVSYACKELAMTLNRRAMIGVGKRWFWITLVWHGLICLPISLVLSVMVAASSDLEGMSTLVITWFVCWAGHAAWVIWSAIALGRLSHGATLECRLAGDPV